MPVRVHILGELEPFDSLAVRLAAVTPLGVRVQVRLLDERRTVEAEARVRDGTRFVRAFAPPNFARPLGEVHHTFGWGVVLEDMPGVSLARIAVPIPDEVAALLLFEGARTLEALYTLRDPDTGKLMMPTLRALDPRSILISRSGRVTFTNLDSLLVRWTERRCDTRRGGPPVVAAETPEHKEQLAWSPATGVYLLGCRVAEAMEAGEGCSDGSAPLSDGALVDHDEDWAAHLGGLRRHPDLCALVRATLRANPLHRVEPAALADAAARFLAGREGALGAWLAGLPPEPAVEPSLLLDEWLKVVGFEGGPVVEPRVAAPSATGEDAGPAAPASRVDVPSPPSEPSERPVTIRAPSPPRIPARAQAWCIGEDVPDELAEARTVRMGKGTPMRDALPMLDPVPEAPSAPLRLPRATPRALGPAPLPAPAPEVHPAIVPAVAPKPAPSPAPRASAGRPAAARPAPRASASLALEDLVLAVVPPAAVLALAVFAAFALAAAALLLP